MMPTPSPTANPPQPDQVQTSALPIKYIGASLVPMAFAAFAVGISCINKYPIFIIPQGESRSDYIIPQINNTVNF